MSLFERYDRSLDPTIYNEIVSADLFPCMHCSGYSEEVYSTELGDICSGCLPAIESQIASEAEEGLQEFQSTKKLIEA